MVKLSIIIPAKNEAENLDELLPKILGLNLDAEMIVVNDGSTDETALVCEKHGITVVPHPYPKGNGAAIKTGARIAAGEILVFMDGDGQHDPKDIKLLLDSLSEGYDMVVGYRDFNGHASLPRYIANYIYNRFSSWMVGHDIRDLTSGFRAIRSNKFREFIHLLPNGFSYPTTITMAFFRAGYSVKYQKIEVRKRLGRSHVSLVKDGIRFLLIIFRVGTLYSPLKIFFPVSLLFFIIGIIYYIFTFITMGRFTNMTALLLSNSFLIFLIGLVSEQITALFYQKDK